LHQVGTYLLNIPLVQVLNQAAYKSVR